MNKLLSHITPFSGIMKCLLILLCSGCSESEEVYNNPKGEYIYRLHNEYMFTPPEPKKNELPLHAWNDNTVNGVPKITKEYFRCKGCSANPYKSVERKDETVVIADCGGIDKHSLPIRDGKEFIYPIQIDLLNHLQSKTGKRVIITSGHRCPEHNTYVDASNTNLYSKHLIGAEVSFYIQGMEYQPEKVVHLLLDYYSANYPKQSDYTDFKRYEKEDSHTSTQPWYNKEVFIKLFKQNEGRNFDNNHLYPYISIQVRYDKDRQERVNYSWQQAQNYWRK